MYTCIIIVHALVFTYENRITNLRTIKKNKVYMSLHDYLRFSPRIEMLAKF